MQTIKKILWYEKPQSIVQRIKKHYRVRIYNEIPFVFGFLCIQRNVLLGFVLILLLEEMLGNV